MTNRIIQRGISLFTILVVAVLAWTLLFQPHHPEQVTMPKQLGSLPQTELVTGAQAISQIAQMHQTNIAISEGYIAKYGQGDGTVTIWISGSPSEREGQALFDEMDQKMPLSKVFTNRQVLRMKGTKVVRVSGMGQEHYYWVKGKLNFWVAVAGVDPSPVLEEVMTKI